VSRAALAALAVAAALAAGCAAGAASSGPGAGAGPSGEQVVIAADADPAAAAGRVAALARGADVVYLGELHDSAEHHARQARILEAILTAGGRPARAFEMLPETRQEAVDAAVRGDGGPAEVERRLAWRAGGWPDFGMYWPLFQLARRHDLPVVAADLDPAVNRRISRAGLGAAGEAPARLRSALPDDPARDRAIARRIQEAHCNLLPESRTWHMLESWYARNVVIARRLLQALERAPQVVVIIGRGHQSPGGVPDQLAALRPGTRQLVVAFVEEREGEPRWGPDGETADVVWLTPGRPRPDYCQGLRERLG
jgi:uncharacterized iron-regulated protein